MLIVSFIVPQIALASWWNPFSWSIWSNIQSFFSIIFNKSQTAAIVPLSNPIIAGDVSESPKTEETKTKESQTPTPTPNLTSTPTSTPTSIPNPTPNPASTCTPDWQCNDWSTCAASQKSRTCTDSNNCGVATDKPTETQFCCFSDWSCEPWSTCSSGWKTRICTVTNNCSGTTSRSSETLACTNCLPNWQCGNWSICLNSIQTRTCSDANSCGITTGEPSETQSCTLPTPTLSVSCLANPSSAQTNQSVIFISSVAISGGTGTYIYSWTGDCIGYNANCSNSFSQAGTKTATLTVNFGGQTKTTNCSATIIPIRGCTDSTMKNYNPKAEENDGSCVSWTYGCTDINADNYDSKAEKWSNICVYSPKLHIVSSGYRDGTTMGAFTISAQYGDVIIDSSNPIQFQINPLKVMSPISNFPDEVRLFRASSYLQTIPCPDLTCTFNLPDTEVYNGYQIPYSIRLNEADVSKLKAYETGNDTVQTTATYKDQSVYCSFTGQ